MRITLLFTIANFSHPFFFQIRPYKNVRLSIVIKFKTINDKKDDLGNLLSLVRRVAPTGRFIPSTSPDEILQLLNVIRGLDIPVILILQIPTAGRQRHQTAGPGIRL